MHDRWFWCRAHLRPEQARRNTNCRRVGPLRSSQEARAVGKVLDSGFPPAVRKPIYRAILWLLVNHNGHVSESDGVVNALHYHLVEKRGLWNPKPWNLYSKLVTLRGLGFVDFCGRKPKGTITELWLTRSVEEVRELLQSTS